MHRFGRLSSRGKRQKTRIPGVLRAPVLFACAFFATAMPAWAQTTSLTVSNEVYGNNATARGKAALLDDSWAAGFPTGAFMTDLFAGGSGLSGTKTFTDPIDRLMVKAVHGNRILAEDPEELSPGLDVDPMHAPRPRLRMVVPLPPCYDGREMLEQCSAAGNV